MRPSAADALSAGLLFSDLFIWQQEGAVVIADALHSCIVPWQHAWEDALAAQAKSGNAVQRTTTASITSPAFLPTGIV